MTHAMHRRIDQPTSIAAAKSILPRLSNLQRSVLNVLRQHYADTGDGLTDLQLEQHELFEGRRPSTIRKRRLELQRKNYVKDSGRTRGKLTVWIPVAAVNIAAKPTTPAASSNQATIDLKRATRNPRQIAPSRREWTSQETALIEWFQSSRDQLPTESFHLCPGVRVIDPARFFDILEAQIRAGPNDARARCGALKSDLEKLKQLFAGQ